MRRYLDSAMEKTYSEGIRGNGDNVYIYSVLTASSNIWYLPSIDELTPLLNEAMNKSDYNIKNYKEGSNDVYWSSRGSSVDSRLTRAARINNGKIEISNDKWVAGTWYAQRSEKYRLRQCCNVIPQNKYQQ